MLIELDKDSCLERFCEYGEKHSCTSQENSKFVWSTSIFFYIFTMWSWNGRCKGGVESKLWSGEGFFCIFTMREKQGGIEYGTAKRRRENFEDWYVFELCGGLCI